MVIAGFIFPGVQVPSAWGGARSISKCALSSQTHCPSHESAQWWVYYQQSFGSSGRNSWTAGWNV